MTGEVTPRFVLVLVLVVLAVFVLAGFGLKSMNDDAGRYARCVAEHHGDSTYC